MKKIGYFYINLSPFSNKNHRVKIASILNKEKDEFSYSNNIPLDKNKLIQVKKKNENDNLHVHSQPLLENPEYRELYKSFSLTVSEEMLNDLDDIAHNKEINGKEYKYGVIAKNDIPFTDLMPKKVEEKIPPTPNENLYELLGLDNESSYESLVLKIQEEYNHGMYKLVM